MRAYRWILPVAVLAVGLAAGTQGDSGIGPLRLAEGHLSAVLIVQRWAALAYAIHPPRDHSCPPSQTQGVNNPDGSFTFGFTSEDCSTGTVTFFPDGRFHTVTMSVEGFRETVDGKPTAFTDIGGFPFPVAYRLEHRLSNGDNAKYTQRFELGQDPFNPSVILIVKTTTTGALRLASGKVARFQFVQPRPAGGSLTFTDSLDLALPGGDRLHWQIPVTQSFDDFGNLLDHVDFTRPAPGSYRSKRSTFRFSVSGEGEEFTRWTLSGGGGVRGVFTLSPDFSGRGRALKGGKLQFVGAWNRHAVGRVLLADGRAAVAGPTAGATDFGQSRFRALGLANAPTPGL